MHNITAVYTEPLIKSNHGSQTLFIPVGTKDSSGVLSQAYIELS